MHLASFLAANCDLSSLQRNWITLITSRRFHEQTKRLKLIQRHSWSGYRMVMQVRLGLWRHQADKAASNSFFSRKNCKRLAKSPKLTRSIEWNRQPTLGYWAIKGSRFSNPFPSGQNCLIPDHLRNAKTPVFPTWCSKIQLGILEIWWLAVLRKYKQNNFLHYERNFRELFDPVTQFPKRKYMAWEGATFTHARKLSKGSGVSCRQ